MFRNYFTAALRNMVRNRLYAAINILGLSVGLTATLLIALFVHDEFSYDTWLPNHERTYLVTETLDHVGRTSTESHMVPVELAESLQLAFPGIEAIARISDDEGDVSLRRGDIEANEKIYWADPNIFDLLSLSAIAGEIKTALEKPDGVVLTRRIAQKYFGKSDVIGETIEINRKHVVHVAAVIEDLPSNTHLRSEIFVSGLASFSFLAQRKANPLPPQAWNSAGYTYLRLGAGTSAAAFEGALPEFLETRMKERTAFFAKVSLWLVPLRSIHRTPDNSTTAMKPVTDPNVVYALAVVGLLILIVASINFVNLMTARATRRAVEVGVRKTTGAARRNLIVQFLGEAYLYVAVSAVIAVIAVSLMLPVVDAFLDRQIAFLGMGDASLGIAMIGVALMVGTLAGFYPAFVLSRFQPASAFRSQHRGTSPRLRNALVIVQFAILIVLTIGVGVIYGQSSFALNGGLRLDKDQVLLIGTDCKTVLPERIRALPGVRTAACSARNGLSFGSGNGNFSRPGRDPVTTAIYGVDVGYLELYGMHPVAGRFLDRDRAGDIKPLDIKATKGPNVVINETAAHRFGFATPEEAIGQSITVDVPGGGPSFEIIGVVPDFSLDTVHSLILPSFYFFDQAGFRWLSVKLTGSDLPETLAAIDRLWKEVGDPRPMSRLFLDQEFEKLYLDIKRQSELLAAFSLIAILVAALGLFGLASFAAEQRTKEIGIRKSMGATRRDILRLILWQFTKPVLLANIIAWPVSYFIMRRWLEGFAYHIDLSPWMFLAASAAALVIAVATVIGHALLVARAQPVAALRYE